jgi:hypothetical protein
MVGCRMRARGKLRLLNQVALQLRVGQYGTGCTARIISYGVTGHRIAVFFSMQIPEL